MPAKAGIQGGLRDDRRSWTSGFAGVTNDGTDSNLFELDH